jgi:hypothetical protein
MMNERSKQLNTWLKYMTEMGAMLRGRPRTCCDRAKTKKDAAVILLTKQ